MAKRRNLETVAGPTWLTTDKLEGKQTGIYAKFDLAITEPKVLSHDLYPTYTLDDPSRPRIFDCHVLKIQGFSIWPETDCHRVELHVEHGALRIYSQRQVSQYRTKLAMQQQADALKVAAESGRVDGAKDDGAKRGRGGKSGRGGKGRNKGGVENALVRSIYQDVQLFSSTAETVSTAKSWPSVPLLPLSLDFSLRDLADIWVDTSFRHLCRLTFHTGFGISLLMSDSEALAHCICWKLKQMYIYTVKTELMVRKEMINRAKLLASQSRAIRAKIQEKKEKSHQRRGSVSLPHTSAGNLSGIAGVPKVEIEADDVLYLDPYDVQFVLGAIKPLHTPSLTRSRSRTGSDHQSDGFTSQSESEWGGSDINSDDDDLLDGEYLARRLQSRYNKVKHIDIDGEVNASEDEADDDDVDTLDNNNNNNNNIVTALDDDADADGDDENGS